MKKILLIENYSQDFISSRLDYAKYLKRKNHDVYAMIPLEENENHKLIEKEGIITYRYPLAKNSINLIDNYKSVYFFYKTAKNNNFDLVHSFRFQANFYSCLTKLFLSRKNILVLHVTGLGIAFSNKKNLRFLLLKITSKCIFFFNSLVANKIIFQNYDDEKELWLDSFFDKKYSVVEGSGVDIEKYNKKRFNIHDLRGDRGLEGKLVITFVSRLVWEKGVKEVVYAVRELLPKYPNFYLQVVGDRDLDNPESVTLEFINDNKVEGSIDFLGKRSDIPELMATSDLYVYPSYYREGLPRTGLEALATGLPIITTNSPGCNLVVEDGKNGYLVEPKSVEAVKEAIEKIYLENLFEIMGKNSRKLAEEKFQNEIIYERIYTKYLEIM